MNKTNYVQIHLNAVLITPLFHSKHKNDCFTIPAIRLKAKSV